MPAPITNFIPHSCFGYYDEAFEECFKKCKIANACKNASESDQYDEVRKIYKFKSSQIKKLVEEWGREKCNQ